MNHKYTRLTLLGFWFCGILVFFYNFLKSDLTFIDLQHLIEDFIQRWSVMAPLAYILVYIIRPLILFPATLLTALSGALFGPIWGIAYTIIGENLSANVSFIVGRYFGKDIMENLIRRNKVIPVLDRRIYENQFMSILILRLIYMPFDVVGFMAGFRNLRQLDFALGTFFGIMPGLVTFVLLGSSFTDPKNLVFTGIAFLIGIAISFFLKMRTGSHLQNT
ncbi:MAG: TVP38/TMEM64 family protein [Proteobacteria bacterium]|nr:TVP38/TMEM64 family protein [Pseudomonadota bacterium]